MGACASCLLPSRLLTMEARDFQPTVGAMVLVQCVCPLKPQTYMVRAQDTWRSFPSVGFLVDGIRGPGEQRSWDIIMAGPLPLTLVAPPAAGHAVRIPLQDLFQHQDVQRIAVCMPDPPFSSSEVSRIKAFAAKATERPGCTNRARLLAKQGRRVMLPELVAEMLVATGRMVKTSPAMYRATRGTWSMPDVVFLDNLPTALTPGSNGSLDPANTDEGLSLVERTSGSGIAPAAVGTSGRSRDGSGTSVNQTARRQQQGAAHALANQPAQGRATDGSSHRSGRATLGQAGDGGPNNTLGAVAGLVNRPSDGSRWGTGSTDYTGVDTGRGSAGGHRSSPTSPRPPGTVKRVCMFPSAGGRSDLSPPRRRSATGQGANDTTSPHASRDDISPAAVWSQQQQQQLGALTGTATLRENVPGSQQQQQQPGALMGTASARETAVGSQQQLQAPGELTVPEVFDSANTTLTTPPATRAATNLSNVSMDSEAREGVAGVSELNNRAAAGSVSGRSAMSSITQSASKVFFRISPSSWLFPGISHGQGSQPSGASSAPILSSSAPSDATARGAGSGSATSKPSATQSATQQQALDDVAAAPGRLLQWDSVGSDVGSVVAKAGSKDWPVAESVSVSGLSATLAGSTRKARG